MRLGTFEGEEVGAVELEIRLLPAPVLLEPPSKGEGRHGIYGVGERDEPHLLRIEGAAPIHDPPRLGETAKGEERLTPEVHAVGGGNRYPLEGLESAAILPCHHLEPGEENSRLVRGAAAKPSLLERGAQMGDRLPVLPLPGEELTHSEVGVGEPGREGEGGIEVATRLLRRPLGSGVPGLLDVGETELGQILSDRGEEGQEKQQERQRCR